MKINKFLALWVLLLIFSVSSVFAAPEAQKIAVVDIQKIVSSSAQVKSLNASHEAKLKEISEFIKKAQADVDKQKDDAKKKTLVESYEKQLKAKREAAAKDYAAKLKASDESITKQISDKAVQMGYTMVLPKTVVIYGGDDITETILKVIK